MSWRDKARCLGEDPERWFPVGSRNDKAARAAATEYARGICGECPVRVSCARDALKTGKTQGIWAGVDLGDRTARDKISDEERKALEAVTEEVPA